VSAVRADSWRGVASEEVDEFSPTVAGLLRRRSRRLLAALASPYRRQIALAAVLITVRSSAYLSIPYLVGLGIDRGIRPGGRGNLATLAEVVGVLLVALLVNAVANYAFLRVSGKAGADILFDLRRMLFAHVQQLSISFYERYTSGRIISRLTSDIDALQELLATGLTSVITSLISVVAISAILINLDVRLGLLALVAMPVVVALTYWFRVNSARAYRAVRRAVVLVIVQYVESLGGIRAVQAFRREPRNQEIFEDVNGRYRDANIWSNRLVSTFGPAINLLGRLTTAAVLLYGGYLFAQGDLTLGVLTSFVLYLRQFFDPLQELSQFYNVFQAAGAALEKLAGVLEEAPTVPEPRSPVALEEAKGAVAFEHVTFAYRDIPYVDETTGAAEFGVRCSPDPRIDSGPQALARPNADYTVGLLTSYRTGPFSGFLRLHHQSSHLGDEFILDSPTPVNRVNLSFEEVDLKLSYELTSWFRIYGGGGMLVGRDPSYLPRGTSQVGTELTSPWTLWDGKVRPVAYGDFQANERSNWRVASSVMAGLQFENARIGDRKLQVLAEYFGGPSPNGQFYTQNTEWFGLGIHLYY